MSNLFKKYNQYTINYFTKLIENRIFLSDLVKNKRKFAFKGDIKIIRNHKKSHKRASLFVKKISFSVLN